MNESISPKSHDRQGSDFPPQERQETPEEQKKAGTIIESDEVARGEQDGIARGYSRLSMVMMVVFSGLAIGSDGFNASIIGNIELLMQVIYPDTLTTAVASRLSNAFMVGMIIGMLGFGYISDKLGRKTGAVLTTTILVLGIALSAGASGVNEDGMFWMLIVARGIAGVGAGGEYPVAGAGAAEATDEVPGTRKRRGFIFAMIGDLSASLGFAFGALVPLLLLLCFHQQVRHYEAVWRVSLAMGAIAPLSIFWFRYRMVVSTAYQKSSMRKQRIPYLLVLKKYWRPLLGSCGSWFMSPPHDGTGLPATSDPWICPRGSTWPHSNESSALHRPLWNFSDFGEVGPGSTIVLTASENFPTAVRGHAVGFAAAWSKAGAAIGTQVFKPILASWGDDESRGTQAVFLIGSGFAVLGALLAWFVLQDSSKVLDHGDQEWKDYLESHGYTNIEWGIDNPPLEPQEKKV
ncbi:hypothetical protein N7470_003708 [Penicillium chermesinum]|nr:hypothetical protein N7470_003708 [Penicillium chermesinum]